MSKIKIWLFLLMIYWPIKTVSYQMTSMQKAEIQETIKKHEQEKIKIERYNKEMARRFKSIHSEYIMSESEIEEARIQALPYREVKCELTFYTDLAVCNGPNAGKNAIGGVLTSTSIAVPSIKGKPLIPYGTRIDIGEKYGKRIADDTGSEAYICVRSDGTYVFDVFMPRLKNESDKAYKARIMDMGRVKTTAKIYDKEKR